LGGPSGPLLLLKLPILTSLNLGRPVSPEDHQRNIRVNTARAIPVITDYTPEHKGRVNIAAGGPSLSVKLLKKRKKKGEYLMCVNGVHDHLISEGLVPDALVLLDPKPELAALTQHPHKGVTYYVASCCDPSVFDALEGYDVVLWHAKQFEEIPEAFQIAGGVTTGLRCLNLSYVLGFRDIHFYGLDSCFQDRSHAYASWGDGKQRYSLTAGDREFLCLPYHIEQAVSYMEIIRSIGHLVQPVVHGDGLIAHLIKMGPGYHNCKMSIVNEGFTPDNQRGKNDEYASSGRV